MKLSFMQSFSELENGVRDLNDNIITLRMVPLNSILDSFHRMVEDISFEINKEAKLTVKGGHIKVDKYILDKIYDPLIHLVRNSLDHGIETPEERRESEKSNNGNIIIDCKIEGSHVVIRVSDDGRGLNKDNILFKILENNLADMLEIQNLSENDILSYIFQPGFTTKERVTSISGRGIGLSVVKENIEAIKGKITIENSPGQGLSFVCTFPVSLANVEGFFIYSGGRKFLIPARFVKETIIAKEDQISSITNSDIYNLRGKAIPVYNLNSIIEAKDTEGGNEKVISILVVNDSIGETTGIIINSVLSYGSIVYKALPKNLSTLELIQGVVFDENYDIIPILFIPKVIEKLKGLSRFEVKKKNISTKKTAKTVLIVEDSPNSREILQRIFSLQGYNVFGASDGIDALEIIRKRRPDIILTDIEMPRMDGKTLITNLRKDDSTKNIPVIIISNTVDRIKDTSEMRQLSITGFVAKSRFDEASLVELVNLAIG
jgi:two-component system chemotaxis sensor kinase CheA